MKGNVPQYGGPLKRLTRASRIATGWWEAGGHSARDYFIARSPEHGLVWIYRDRPDGGSKKTAGICRACMPEHHLKPGAALDEDIHGLPPLLGDGPDPLPRYAELYCLSNFSFQRGASHPQELVRRAYDLGYEAWPSPTNAPWRGWCGRWLVGMNTCASSSAWTTTARSGAGGPSSCCTAASSTLVTAAWWPLRAT
jgi:hypothetical protein